MGEFCFAQSIQKLPENKGKLLFYETYYEESVINQKHLIWSQDKIITKFGQKKWASLFSAKVYESCMKVKEKCYFTKLTTKIAISTENPLIGSKIR